MPVKVDGRPVLSAVFDNACCFAVAAAAGAAAAVIVVVAKKNNDDDDSGGGAGDYDDVCLFTLLFVFVLIVFKTRH